MNRYDLPPRNAQPAELHYQPSWIDSLLERPRPLCKGAMSPLPVGVRTVVARLPAHLDAAEALVRRRYAWRGYRLAPIDECNSDQRVTLLAEGDGRLLGTLTVRGDSPRGLLAEGTYAAEIEALRREGRRVGELTRLALEQGVDWKAALDALVHGAWLLTHILYALTDVVIEVNPRHVSFYQRVFGFVLAAAGGVCKRVGAPSALLQLDLEHFGRRLERASSEN